jgi:uncharacterized membrane protein
MSAEYYAGPVPHPSIVEGWEQVCPGAADRILRMAERQQAHRQEIELDVVTSNTKAQRRGTTYGFILAMTAVLGGIFLIHEGKEVTGIVSIIGALASLVGVFIYGKKKQKKDLDAKKPSDSKGLQKPS